MDAYCRSCDRAVDARGAWPGRCPRCRTPVEAHPVRDLVRPGLRVLFIGINPGIETARRRAHFGNPVNPFWRLLHAAGLTPRLLAPTEQAALLETGIGVSNVVGRATRGSSGVTAEDVRRGRERLVPLLQANAPEAIAFVGKQAYAFAVGERANNHGPQAPWFGIPVFVLPSTSPANASVSAKEKEEWFRRLTRWLASTPASGSPEPPAQRRGADRRPAARTRRG